jgi:hypothetical protein
MLRGKREDGRQRRQERHRPSALGADQNGRAIFAAQVMAKIAGRGEGTLGARRVEFISGRLLDSIGIWRACLRGRSVATG